MTTPQIDPRSIESDAFPFEFLSRLAERESWRKELHRPVYHVHKWWANRLGSVFRGILLGCALPESANLQTEFYRRHALSNFTVFDPFMGSGTTIGEAHKLGFTALGRDINPVAVQAVTTALGPVDRDALRDAFEQLSDGVGAQIRGLYATRDSRDRAAEVLYYFWVMQIDCPKCAASVDLFPSFVIARNAFPHRKPEVQVVCPGCGDIFPGVYGRTEAACRSCDRAFDPTHGTARGKQACCPGCDHTFTILDSIARANGPPRFRLYGKLVLTPRDSKEYLPATDADLAAYADSSATLQREIAAGAIHLPELALERGYNTRQAMGYGFHRWRDFFNDRQLLALSWLRGGIEQLADPPSRRALLTLFSGTLEFNNLFASYKGEGTGAVRHTFSHHILKPERTPIEANLWGTPRSSGSFSGMFRSRLMRALDYRDVPTELNGRKGPARVCSPPFSGRIEAHWPAAHTGNKRQNSARLQWSPRGIYLSCGDSADTGLPEKCIDLVVTDPPFFDNVHYSELADFFHAWQQLSPSGSQAVPATTRAAAEVQDTDPARFADKLRAVFHECHRILKDDGLLVFTYHHSRAEGWHSLAEAILGAGFRVVNSQPVKAEMSVATPKMQAKDPIQLDIILVCRKEQHRGTAADRPSPEVAVNSARRKLQRLCDEGFRLSRNDRKIIVLGQLLTVVETTDDIDALATNVDFDPNQCEASGLPPVQTVRQGTLF